MFSRAAGARKNLGFLGPKSQILNPPLLLKEEVQAVPLRSAKKNVQKNRISDYSCTMKIYLGVILVLAG